MILLIIALFLLVIWGVSEFLIGCYVWWQRRKIRNRLRVEQTRRHFTEIRNTLMDLAISKKVDVKSCSFKIFYRVCTFVMRRPDQYPELSKSARIAVFASMNHDGKQESEIFQEAKLWPDEMKDLALRMAEAFGMLMYDYSTILRVALWLEKKIGVFSRLKSLTHFARMSLEENQIKKDKIIFEFEKSKECFEHLAAT